MKITKCIIIYAVLITALCLFAIKSCSNYRVDNERLSTNQEALIGKMETYKTNEGKNAAKIIQLEFTNSEYEKLMHEQSEKIKKLGIKIKRLESVSITGTETNANGSTPIKDSVIYRYVDSVRYVDSIRYFEWKDTWSTISGIIKPDSVECSYHGVDTLNVICYRVPKKFLGFIPCGTKYIEVEIVNANENTKITYGQSIKLKKKK